MQDFYHQPYTLNPIDPLKEPLKGALIDPFKGTPSNPQALHGSFAARYSLPSGVKAKR